MNKHIEKKRATVRVCLAGGDDLDGFFMLAPRAEHRDGAETILELLNSGKRVIPLILSDDDSVFLVTRTRIDWVAAGPGVDPGLVCPPTYLVSREERVEIQFGDGRAIEGMVQMEVEDGFARVSDFLNLADDFFPMETRFGTVVVNKNRMRRALLCEARARRDPPADRSTAA